MIEPQLVQQPECPFEGCSVRDAHYHRDTLGGEEIVRVSQDDRILWVPDADDSHLSDVFRWLRERDIKFEVKNNARDLLLNGSVAVFDGWWIIYENGVVYSEPRAQESEI